MHKELKTSHLFKARIESKPKQVNRWIAKKFIAARLSNDPILKLVNKWIATSYAYKLGKIIPDLKQELGKLIIWVGDTGANVQHINLKGLYDAGILTGKSYHGEDWKVDPNGHGTHTLSNCASLWRLAEVIQEKEILLSMIPGNMIKEIKMCKVLTDNGDGVFEWTRDMLLDIKALPVEQRPHIVNLSLGGDPGFIKTALGVEIVSLMAELSVYTIFVTAAGNRGYVDPDGQSVGFPANSNPPVVISNMESLSSPNNGSSVGMEVDFGFFGTLQLGASGKDNTGYTVKTGTSMSTPAFTSSLGVLLACMWKMGMDRRTSIAVLFPYLRSKKLVFDYGNDGEDAITGQGIILFPDTDLTYLYKVE